MLQDTIYENNSGSPFYRKFVKGELNSWRIVVDESDINISSQKVMRKEAEQFLKILRNEIKTFITNFPQFLVSLEPVKLPDDINIPQVVIDMAEAGNLAGVGPMAAVAGAIAEKLACFLARKQQEVIVENGGDIFFYSTEPRTCAIYAGNSPFSFNIGLKLNQGNFPCALCTSSGTVGPSLSFGKVDAAIVVAANGALADALATKLANSINRSEDLKYQVEKTEAIPDVIGALAIMGEKLAVKGDLKLVEITTPKGARPLRVKKPDANTQII